MQGCLCVVGLVPSYPDDQSRWLAWVHSVVPGEPVGGPLREEASCAEPVHLRMLDAVSSAKALASSYCAVKAIGTVN